MQNTNKIASVTFFRRLFIYCVQSMCASIWEESIVSLTEVRVAGFCFKTKTLKVFVQVTLIIGAMCSPHSKISCCVFWGGRPDIHKHPWCAQLANSPSKGCSSNILAAHFRARIQTSVKYINPFALAFPSWWACAASCKSNAYSLSIPRVWLLT